MSTFRQCFTDQLIPAFQTATQKMFQQIAEALNKGEGGREGDLPAFCYLCLVADTCECMTSLAACLQASPAGL